MLRGNASSIQVHLDSYLRHPHWMCNTMNYVQAVAIAKKCADFVSSFHEWHPCSKWIQFNIPPRSHKSSSRRMSHFVSIMHITCVALSHTCRQQNTHSCCIKNYQLKGAVIPPNKILTVNLFRNWTTNNLSLTRFILDILATTVSENRNVIGTLPVEIFSVFSHLKGKSQPPPPPNWYALHLTSRYLHTSSVQFNF